MQTTPHDRAAAMARRLAAAARRAGIERAGRERIDAALETAMRPRRERLEHDHHPDYLHPGRTALILLDDAGVADATVLAAATLCETLHPELAATHAEIATAAGPDVLALVAAVPAPAAAGDSLLERLVTAEQEVRLIACAERLDHARHLHLRGAAEWRDVYEETRDVYLPIAARTHPVLERRYLWWVGMFARRFLGR